ncbi:hypothetical protein [Chryseobacterium defluvii]|uniref:Multicopper oxidase n=1 Tax=Chryseobacterium defluvii TaxID=160396 RepID=A0A495SBC3_9FLAO|nr:hypothetical protein [Chryseobacterium defluvii]RKS97285.1 hypothetical protein BCF58_1405 [Chryseobacterium defluvii]
MKKLSVTIIISLAALSVTACKQPVKETESLAEIQPNPVKTDKLTKEVFTDSFGDQMEVTVNETQNTITVHLDGKTYELKKNEDLPEYTASNAEYQYSDIRGNITFLKKNVDMVLFHYKHNGKNRTSAKMASY